MWMKLRGIREGRFGRIVSGSTSPRAYSEGPAVLRSRVVLATVVVVACASCSEDGGTSTPTEPPATPSASTAPTGSVPPELAGYSKTERTAFEQAVTEYDAFTRRNDRFYAAGRTTVAAKRFYQRYAVDWSTAWGDLAQVANSGITVTGSTRTVWTKPEAIELGAKNDVIRIRRCLDESGRVVTQGGETVDQPQLNDPHVYSVRLEKRPGEAWWRSGIAEQGQPC